VPKRKAIHAIVDNYATHKHPKVRRWLARHPRRTFHFTPTSASWLNAVEGIFAKLTKRRLKRGVFRSLPDLQIAETNKNPKPFVWTATPTRFSPLSNAVDPLASWLPRRCARSWDCPL
jgi:transposase